MGKKKNRKREQQNTQESAAGHDDDQEKPGIGLLVLLLSPWAPIGLISELPFCAHVERRCPHVRNAVKLKTIKKLNRPDALRSCRVSNAS